MPDEPKDTKRGAWVGLLGEGFFRAFNTIARAKDGEGDIINFKLYYFKSCISNLLIISIKDMVNRLKIGILKYGMNQIYLIIG